MPATNQKELATLLRSRTPLIAIETADETASLALLNRTVLNAGFDTHMPLYRWSITDGLQRIDIELAPQPHNSQPGDVLGHIRAVTNAGVYALLDFHPYLNDPLHVRKLKDICLRFRDNGGTLVLISHRLDIPAELRPFTARFELAMPDEGARERIVREVAREWSQSRPASQPRVKADERALALLVGNLAGLTEADTRRLAHNAIHDDGAIDHDDVRNVMRAKYELLNQDGLLHYEFDTARFSDIGGLTALKRWLNQRRDALLGQSPRPGLDRPRGVLLIGVQGCGKSLAAKASAGVFGTPLLRLDFGSLFNKYHGESERNLREALRLAETMSPCVLWIDELEKGLGADTNDSGTSRRVLGSFLTWLGEKRAPVFVVATANEIDALPPEMVRKGRFDEIFFVDLPDGAMRREILAIHLGKRGESPERHDLRRLAGETEGFSGAELEQLIVAAFYAADAAGEALGTQHLIAEARRTRPLSTVMAERIAALRAWASERTVPAH
jgi:SpoVK/Ycf46/Vps4 family AAA+-type ATPase